MFEMKWLRNTYGLRTQDKERHVEIKKRNECNVNIVDRVDRVVWKSGENKG